MPLKEKYDAVIIGSGPNGLAAGIKLAEEGLSVLILEAKDEPGGGTRTKELTLPGFKHDVCSAIHPLAVSSLFFKSIYLEKYGLEWIVPPVQMAHPFDDGSAAVLSLSIDETSKSLVEDELVYKEIIIPLLKDWPQISDDILGPLRIPSKPLSYIDFGLYAIQSVKYFTNTNFIGARAKAFFAGLSAHSFLPLTYSFTNAVGMVLLLSGHHKGWPFPKGGSQLISNAMINYFTSLGGEIEVNYPVKKLNDIPEARAVLFDLTPKQILEICGEKFQKNYKKKLSKYRYGPGIFKIDWALSSPIPFINEYCRKAGTIHIGGLYEEIEKSEQIVWEGKVSNKPFVILAQNSLFDNSRAPDGKHTAWAYCHVPNGSDSNITELIENQIERFAPGFKDVILHKHIMNTNDMELYNPNYIGGDINGGLQNWRQLFTRPALNFSPYSTSGKGIYICSSSTPPGGGVHGMCGYFSALKVLKDIKKKII